MKLLVNLLTACNTCPHLALPRGPRDDEIRDVNTEVDSIWEDIMRPMAQFGRPATGVCLKPLTEAIYHKAIAPRVPVCAAHSQQRGP